MDGDDGAERCKRVSVKIPVRHHEALVEEAAKAGPDVSVDSVIQDLVRNYLEELAKRSEEFGPQAYPGQAKVLHF